MEIVTSKLRETPMEFGMPGNAVVVIADYEDLREEIVTFLRYRGWSTTGCGTLAQAQEICRRHVPAVVVSDVYLPDGNAVAFCRRMAEEYPKTKWVLISGNADLAGAAIGAAMTGFAVIERPVTLNALDRYISDAAGAAPGH